MKTIFISHDASRTGAPIILKDFIGWWQKRTSSKSFIILRNGGVLESEFEKIGTTAIYYPRSFHSFSSLGKRVLNRLGYYDWKLKKYHEILLKNLQNETYDLIYNNTVVNVDVLRMLQPLQLPVVTHVRELETTIQHFGGAKLIAELDQLTTVFLTGSHAVKNHLINKYGISEAKIHVSEEHIEIPEKLPDHSVSESLKANLNIPSEAFIVGAVGSGIWRKGYDVFLQTAIATCRQCPDQDIYFIWVGGFKPEIEERIRFDIKNSGFEKQILFVGVQTEIMDYFSIFDVFVLASREEPAGLVPLMAALFSTPVICFEKSGGTEDFVTEDCGLAIPYLNIPELVDKLLFFKHHPEEKKRYGENAKNKVITQRNLTQKSEEILNILEALV